MVKSHVDAALSSRDGRSRRRYHDRGDDGEHRGRHPWHTTKGLRAARWLVQLLQVSQAIAARIETREECRDDKDTYGG
jgi:hypothetical protein